MNSNLAKIHFRYCPDCLKAHRMAGFQSNQSFQGAYSFMCEIGQNFVDELISSIRKRFNGSKYINSKI